MVIFAVAMITSGIETSASASSLPRYYVSVGGSYSIGFQPSPIDGPTSGYTAVIAQSLGMTLENFGCAGATTRSVLTKPGCTKRHGIPLAKGRAPYSTEPQATAAKEFVATHFGEIGLITVDVGGNDFFHCFHRLTPVTCATAAAAVMQAEVTTLVKALRAAAGPTVPIIGLTYPDMMLGKWVYPHADPKIHVAKISVPIFKDIVNPALKRAYSTANVKFVNITAETGGFVSLRKKVSTAFGTIPVSVARVCKLTWACTKGNVHPTTAGYRAIGDAVVAAYRG